MRHHKREAARRVSLLLVIVGWCVALVLCSCEGNEERAARMEKRAEKQKQEQVAREQRLGAERLLILGKWTRPGETVEFMRDGRMIVGSPDKYGRVNTVFLTYWMKRKGEITFRRVGIVAKEDVKRADIRISGDELYLRVIGDLKDKVYYRVHKGVMGKR